MNFSINLGSWRSVFAVPVEVVDKHIKLTGSAQLKVLLFLLRHSGEGFSSEDIAERLSMHPADVSDAMQYWVETGILRKDDGIFSPSLTESETLQKDLDNNKTSQKAISEKDNLQPEVNISPVKITRPLSRPQKPDSVTLSKRINESSDIAFLMQEAQVILGKTISIGDSATLLMLHDTDGLPVDVIIMLLQYAVSISKNNMKYIEKTGIKWSDEGIDSLEKAEKKIRSLSLEHEAWQLITKTTGMDYHSPTANELKFSDRWVNEWKFDRDMIREAYERSVDNTGKFTFKYANKIFESWYKKGIKSIDQAKEESLKSKSEKPKGKDSPSYDIEEYERSSIFGD